MKIVPGRPKPGELRRPNRFVSPVVSDWGTPGSTRSRPQEEHRASDREPVRPPRHLDLKKTSHPKDPVATPVDRVRYLPFLVTFSIVRHKVGPVSVSVTERGCARNVRGTILRTFSSSSLCIRGVHHHHDE